MLYKDLSISSKPPLLLLVSAFISLAESNMGAASLVKLPKDHLAVSCCCSYQDKLGEENVSSLLTKPLPWSLISQKKNFPLP